jgi:hypothetical protein
MLLVVNLTTRRERGGPAEKKKFPDSGHDTTSMLARRRSCRPSSTVKPAAGDPFVDKLLNIHRIECAELPLTATPIFLSSFDPVQKQGLSDRFRHT